MSQETRQSKLTKFEYEKLLADKALFEENYKKCLLAIPEFIAKHKKRLFEWNNGLINAWEFYALRSFNFINNKGILQANGYSAFYKAKNEYFDKLKNREFAQNINKAPTSNIPF